MKKFGFKVRSVLLSLILISLFFAKSNGFASYEEDAENCKSTTRSRAIDRDTARKRRDEKHFTEVRLKLKEREALLYARFHQLSLPKIEQSYADPFSRLPHEISCFITSFLSFEELIHFKYVSQKTYEIFKFTIKNTNFLTSSNLYAQDFLNSIKNELVQFADKPRFKSIKIAVSVQADEVHFRDPDHLRNIVQNYPRIEPQTRLYFIFDKNVKEGEELVSYTGAVKKSYFILVPHDDRWIWSININCRLNLSQTSDKNSIKCLVITGNAETFHYAQHLANTIENFDEHLFDQRTVEAFSLMNQQEKKRIKSPNLFPDLSILCPEGLIIHNSILDIRQKDYILSNELFIYRAFSTTSLKKLRHSLPGCGQGIHFINSDCSKSGIYCLKPLEVMPGFQVTSQKDLLITGDFPLKNYNISIKTKSRLWFVNVMIQSDQISRESAPYVESYHFNNPISPMMKPADIPHDFWNNFLQFNRQKPVANYVKKISL